jgi:hypothetical protein
MMARFQRRQITLHDAPDQCEIHTKVIVRETIAHTGDCFHGISGRLSLVVSESCLTASPMISSVRMTAS